MKICAHSNTLWITIIMILMLLVRPAHGQSLKDINIGEKYSGPRTIETKVGGYQGTLTIGTLKDSTVTKFYFISKKIVRDRTDVQLWNLMADRFLNNAETNYRVTFDLTMWKHREDLTNLWQDLAICEKQGIVYLIASAVNLGGHSNLDLRDQEAQIVFHLYNKELTYKAGKEDDRDF